MASPPPSGLPDPALVVLVGASGSGKSHWAEERYRVAEIVSSDLLRGVVGSGRHDLDASTEAFHLLDLIVAGRIRRGLTTVVDTLGLDTQRRRGYLALARAHGMPAVAVAFDTAAEVCRRRNSSRDRPVPAPALAQQLRTASEVLPALASEGWDLVSVVVDSTPEPAPPPPTTHLPGDDTGGLDVVLQVSRFPWGEDPAGWLTEIAVAADAAGFTGIALMDHLVQIPQVGRAWEPIPEPWVTLGLLAGLPTRLRLGTLVSPVTFRPAGITAKAASTLDALSGGRAFLGVGAGWWEREHLGFGLPFPPPEERLDALESELETLRALWAPGTKAYAGDRAALPETTCYPRPVGPLPVVVGGSGARTLGIAGRLADACNVRSDPAEVERAASLVSRACERAGRDPAEVALTVLDLPVVGRDRDDTWERVERLRGRTPAAAYARSHHAGTAADQADRWRRLQDLGVSTVFVALGDLERADDLERLAPAVAAVSG